MGYHKIRNTRCIGFVVASSARIVDHIKLYILSSSCFDLVNPLNAVEYYAFYRFNETEKSRPKMFFVNNNLMTG